MRQPTSRRPRRTSVTDINYADSSDPDEADAFVSMEEDDTEPPLVLIPTIERFLERRDPGNSSVPAVNISSLPPDSELLVKFSGISHVHCQWWPFERIRLLFAEDRNVRSRMNVFLKKSAPNKEIPEAEIFRNPVVERVIDSSDLFQALYPSRAASLGKHDWPMYCLRILDALICFERKRLVYSIPFLRPVEEERDGAPGYYATIEQPMDFTTVQTKLYMRQYRQPREFWHDVKAVFSNARQYNLRNTDVVIQANLLERLFDKLYAEWARLSRRMAEEQAARGGACISIESLECAPDDLPIPEVLSDDDLDERTVLQHITFQSLLAEPERQLLYLVKWKGLSYVDSTWEKADVIDDSLKIAQYHRHTKCPEQLVSRLGLRGAGYWEADLQKKMLHETYLYVKAAQEAARLGGAFGHHHLQRILVALPTLTNVQNALDGRARPFESPLNRPRWGVTFPGDVMKRPVGRPPSRPHPRHGWPPFGVPFPTPLADPRARLQVPASQLHFTSVGSAGQYQPSVPPPAQSSADGSLEPDQKLGPAESCFYSAVGAQYQEQKKPGNPPSDVQRQYPVSPLFKGGLRLFDHQLEGLNWLLDLWSSGRNGILADEMGLGKTIQAMAFMWHLHTKERLRGPFLVVAPLSTVYHWQQTAEAWTDMNCVLYYDEFGKGGRDAIRAHEWCHHALSDVRNGRVGQDTVTRQYQLTETSHYKFHLLVTSYETFMVDNDILAQMPWQYVVLDEAHKLKNRLSKLLLTLRLIACRDILLLTGTFVQNNTEEMWPLLNLVEPVKFCDVELFKQQFGDLQTPEQVGILNKVLRQHLLRRVKEDVAHSIPPLEETIIDVELTILQKAWYRAILEKNLDVLSRMGNSKGPRLMNIEVELRKCCNHPFMLAGVEEREYASCRSAEERLKRFVEASGKMVLLNKLLPKLKDEDHKVLIFSQFNSCLNLIEEFILCRGWKYERIDGSIKGQNRTQAIRRFNDPNHERFVFLLSTRAGGLGINLTSADHVIIFDSDWNPQNDIQATARAHRIGQEKEVKVYRLITTRTYEAEMFARASRKLGLNTAVFHRGAFGGEGPSPREITPNCREIENLLKKGAYYLLDSQASQEFQESNISDILSKKTRLVRYQLCGGSSTFAKTSFKSDQTGDIPIDDPDFWKKLLAESSNRQLLSRLNDGSATRDDNAKRKFMRALEDAVDTIAVGAPADSDADCVLEALVQVQHLRDFCREDRELAEQWLQQASRALESLREKVEPESDQAADPQTSQSARKRTRLTTRDDEEFRCSDDGSEEREPVTKRKRRRRQKRVR